MAGSVCSPFEPSLCPSRPAQGKWQGARRWNKWGIPLPRAGAHREEEGVRRRVCSEQKKSGEVRARREQGGKQRHDDSRGVGIGGGCGKSWPSARRGGVEGPVFVGAFGRGVHGVSVSIIAERERERYGALCTESYCGRRAGRSCVRCCYCFEFLQQYVAVLLRS